MPKSWIEKLEAKGKDLPKIVRLDEKTSKKYGGAKTMVVPHPKDVYAIMASIPEGSLITVKEVRDILAKKYGTDIACPLTTGIFIWIAANASVEIAQKNGQQEADIPFWRTLKSNGQLVDKYPGGIDYQRRKLEAEGFVVVQKRGKWYVDNYMSFVLPVV